jgi:hypothetical protein
MAAGIVGVGAAAVGAVVGVKEFLNFVGEQSQALSDLADHADVASMSAKEFQETMYAAMSKGVGDTDFTSGMDKSQPIWSSLRRGQNDVYETPRCATKMRSIRMLARKLLVK